MVGILFQDINNLYDDVMTDMAEFKVLANDAWRGMIQHEAPLNRHGRAIPHPFRARRQYGSDAGVGGGASSSGGCNCGKQPSNCPAGPPGK
jgi:hypothetical protein